MLLLLFFSALLLLASMSSFFPLGYVPSRSSCPALRVGLAALSWSLAGFEAMFCVAWVGADATGRCDVLLRVLLARTSVQSRPFPLHCRGLQAALSPSHWPCSSWGERDGCICTGGRLICQLRQLGPPLCGPPHRPPSPRTPRIGLVKGKTLFKIFYNVNINNINIYLFYIYNW